MPIKPKCGTGVLCGTGVKMGYGTSERWIPYCWVTPGGVVSILGEGLIQVHVGQPTETFILQSPNLMLWSVRFDGETGLVTLTDNASGTPQRLCLISAFGQEWEATVDNAGLLSVTYQGNIFPARFVLEVTTDSLLSADESMVQVTDTGLVKILAGLGFENETYTLQSPDTALWAVSFNGTTGGVTLTSGASGPADVLQRTSPGGTVFTFSVDNNGLLSLQSDRSPFFYEPSRALAVSNDGIITVRTGYPNETYTIQDQNGALWMVEVDGRTGLVSIRSVADGPPQIVNLTAPDGGIWQLRITTS
jgi:hypothetical protein